MTNLPIKSTLANLQVFYKNFPMQKYVSCVSIPMKLIEYHIPDIFIDKVMEAAQRLITKESLSLTVTKSVISPSFFIVKEVKGDN